MFESPDHFGQTWRSQALFYFETPYRKQSLSASEAQMCLDVACFQLSDVCKSGPFQCVSWELSVLTPLHLWDRVCPDPDPLLLYHPLLLHLLLLLLLHITELERISSARLSSSEQNQQPETEPDLRTCSAAKRRTAPRVEPGRPGASTPWGASVSPAA